MRFLVDAQLPAEALLTLFGANLAAIEAALAEARFVEIGVDRLILHRTD